MTSKPNIRIEATESSASPKAEVLRTTNRTTGTSIRKSIRALAVEIIDKSRKDRVQVLALEIIRVLDSDGTNFELFKAVSNFVSATNNPAFRESETMTARTELLEFYRRIPI